LAITKNLTNAGASWGTPPLIEHIIISNELTDNYIGNSAAQELAVAQNIPSFGFTTSNHLPVSALFQFSTLSSPEYMQNSSRPWTIYPNPVKTELKISSSTTLMNPTEIYDLTGRKMSARNINTNTIDVSALPAGIYLVKIGDTSSKFVKQ